MSSLTWGFAPGFEGLTPPRHQLSATRTTTTATSSRRSTAARWTSSSRAPAGPHL